LEKLLFLLVTQLHSLYLVYSYGIINLNIIVPEDFWEDLESIAKIKKFHSISNNQHGNSPTLTKMVEFKFLSPALPEKVFIYAIMVRVFPSIGDIYTRK